MTNKEKAFVFKALSDENRLNILSMLSENELCACKLLEEFKITQPTLSHHMKVLSKSGLVNSRKEGKWSYYTINKEEFENAIMFLKALEGE